MKLFITFNKSKKLDSLTIDRKYNIPKKDNIIKDNNKKLKSIYCNYLRKF